MKFINFNYLLGASSLFIASCAAFFSIIGIGMLFSGSAVAAMIMAASLEFGKLIATSFLYRYWNKTKLFLKIYLTLSVIILMVITSLGIFGYLSGAYQQSNVENQLIEQKIQSIRDQKTVISEKITASKSRILNITQLRNSQEMRLSQTITNLLIARNPVQLNQIQQQTEELINQSEKNLNNESLKVQTAIEELQQLDQEINKLKLQSGSKKDVQTFKFVADELQIDINKVVKWFIIALISVFDPLAVCLLLAYNTATDKTETDKTETDKTTIISNDTNKKNSSATFVKNSFTENSINNKTEEDVEKINNVDETTQTAPDIHTPPASGRIYPFSF